VIAESFRQSEAAIRRYLRRFIASNHDIDDICQEAVTRALEAAKTRVIDDPKGFLFGVARNVMRKELDRKSRSLIDFLEDFSSDKQAASESDMGSELDEHRRMLQFIDIVTSLPPQCQRVFVMKKVYGFSHREIANRLNISVSTVEKHVAAGMKRSLDEMEKRAANGAPALKAHRLAGQDTRLIERRSKTRTT